MSPGRIAPKESPETMPNITTRQAVFADLEALAALFDRYRQFQGKASDPAAARRIFTFAHSEANPFHLLK